MSKGDPRDEQDTPMGLRKPIWKRTDFKVLVYGGAGGSVLAFILYALLTWFGAHLSQIWDTPTSQQQLLTAEQSLEKSVNGLSQSVASLETRQKSLERREYKIERSLGIDDDSPVGVISNKFATFTPQTP